jgi:TetR/AcrR family transcriptional regulator
MPPDRPRKTRPKAGRVRARGPRRPGRPRLQEVDEARVRERLLEAATELATAQGFETCGLREIAARARVSPAMISYYFGDREGLGEAIYRRAFERVSERVRALIEAPDFARKDGLDELVQIHVAAMTADPWLPKLVASEILAHGASPLRSRLTRDLARGPLMAMIRWLEEEQRQGRLRSEVDARWMAISIASLCAFPFMILPIVGRELGLSLDAGFAERLVTHTQQFLAHGFRARPEDLS